MEMEMENDDVQYSLIGGALGNGTAALMAAAMAASTSAMVQFIVCGNACQMVFLKIG